MNIQRAKQEIENTVRAYLSKNADGEYAIPAIRQRPILLMGPPGIGKTQIMEQAARECGVALVSYTITHHTRQSAVGLPFIRERTYGGKTVSITQYTMSEIIASVYEKISATGLSEGILFIDEINCVSETLAPTMLQFLQCKTFGNQAVPQGWVIVAAGNPPEYNKSVRDFDIVTLDRVKRMDIEPDYEAFKRYAHTAHLHPAILSYLELHPNNFYKIQADIDGTQFVTARGWEDLSNLLDTYESLGLAADQAVIGEYLQYKEVAEDFAAYLDLYAKYRDDYGVEAILQNGAAPSVFARLLRAAFDERLALVGLLLAGLETRFAAVDAATALADGAYALLKTYKQKLSSDSMLTPANTFAALYEADKTDLAHKTAAGLLSRADIHIRKALLAEELSWLHLLQSSPETTNADAAFSLLKMAFAPIGAARTEAEAAAGKALEHAFDLMEQAFAAGQEMTVFVTELTLSPAAQRFILANGCTRYFTYNKTLLLDSRKQNLQRELAGAAENGLI